MKQNDRPRSAADRRPKDKPFYIDSSCPDCGEELVLLDSYEEPDVDEEDIWHDEWTCPNPDCENNGKCFMDWPQEHTQRLVERLSDTHLENSSTVDADKSTPEIISQLFKENKEGLKRL